MTSDPADVSQLEYGTSVTLTCTFSAAGQELKYYFKPPGGADYVLEDLATKEIQMSSAQNGDHQCKVGTSTDSGIVIEAPDSNILTLTMKESKFYRNRNK